MLVAVKCNKNVKPLSIENITKSMSTESDKDTEHVCQTHCIQLTVDIVLARA